MITSREEKMREVQEEIEQVEQKKKRKKFIKKLIKIITILIIIILILYLYIENISTHSIKVREQRIVDRDIPENFDSYKIVYFSDLYYDGKDKKDLDNLVKIINERKPDLILYSGDIIKGNISNKDKEYLISKLKELNAISGKYALTDNDDIKNILLQSEFGTLDDSSELIYYGDGSPINLVGINSKEKNKEILNNTISGGFKIFILKDPDNAKKVRKKASIMLAGKSLNGEICLVPDYLCLYNVDGAKKYYRSFHNVSGVPLYISSGIGTNKFNFRFNSRPSIYFFRLSSGN